MGEELLYNMYFAQGGKHSYNTCMESNSKHTMRLALILAFMVVLLMVVTIDQFRLSGGEGQQAAAVLHVYAD